MAGETPITVVGNLAADPERRETQNGVVTNFAVVSTPRLQRDGQWVDGESITWRCGIWRQPAENVAGSLQKGDRVVVTGFMAQREYTNRDGEKRTVLEIRAEEVAVSLRFATAKPVRVNSPR